MSFLTPRKVALASTFLTIALVSPTAPAGTIDKVSPFGNADAATVPAATTNFATPAPDSTASDSAADAAELGGRLAPQAAPMPNPQADDETPSDVGRDGKPLSPDQIALGAKIRRTLATYEPKHLNARDNSCWEIMHNLIAFGPRTEIFRDGPGGQTVNAMGWLLYGDRCQGQPLIILENNNPHALYGVGLEGHGGQFLAMLAQWKVRPESPIHLDGRDLTIADYIEEEKLTCQSGTELTFKLLALSHYLPSDATWTSRDGEHWDIPKLLKSEIEAPIHGAACGGSHRLFAISSAVMERDKRQEPIDGQYARAAKYIVDYQRYTLGTLQNPDGSFSTEWFNTPADRPGDIDRKLQTTGHMMEWLAWSLPDESLRDPKVIKTVNFLADILANNPNKAWSIGPLGHGLHALVIYHQRMYKEPTLPQMSIAAVEPLKTAAKTASVANPPEPVCEYRDRVIDRSMVERLLPAADAKAAAKATVRTAEQGDGCVESIPATGIRVAMKPSDAPLPPADSSIVGPALPSEAPFDKAPAGTSGP